MEVSPSEIDSSTLFRRRVLVKVARGADFAADTLGAYIITFFYFGGSLL